MEPQTGNSEMLPQIETQYGGNIAKARRAIREESKAYPPHLVAVPMPVSGYRLPGLTKIYRSRDFFVMVFAVDGGITRLTINRADLDGEGQWKAGITWDEIQRLKREAGFGNRLAVEVYPEDEHFVNDANMRHIFILNERPAFAWTSANRSKKERGNGR